MKTRKTAADGGHYDVADGAMGWLLMLRSSMGMVDRHVIELLDLAEALDAAEDAGGSPDQTGALARRAERALAFVEREIPTLRNHAELMAKYLLKVRRDLEAGRLDRMGGRVARSLVARKVLRCVQPGRVEVTVGEAHSADVKRGDRFTVAREDRLRYYGMLDIGGYGFRHDPGLSGRPVTPGVFGPEKMEFAVTKENVGMGFDNGFWAVWEA